MAISRDVIWGFEIMIMRIGFRVDAAKHIGTGHLQRCLTLANYLKAKGHQCIFYCRDYGQAFYNLVLNAGFQLEIIGQTTIGSLPKSEKDWLGVSIEKDSEDFIEKIKEKTIDICIVDHYALNVNWERIIRKHVSKLIVIDDLAREHECEILLDQNFFPYYKQRYDLTTPLTTIKLLGPEYCLLKKEFSLFRSLRNQEQINSNKILINFGGVGNFTLLEKVISVINRVDKYDYILITGMLEKEQFQYLESLVTDKSNIKIMQSSSNMAELMNSSSFAIGACGSTVWERFCLGLNAALVQVADNQRILLGYLAEEDLIDNLGDCNDLTEDRLFEFLSKLDFTSVSYRQRRIKIMELVDGLGVVRTCEKILELSNV
ncbi:UDP-2,4-diacetamido-2,4,6-trideoxy-beta-L-altropyranose hydrolase [Acinetobacter baumannii]|nr:UDP-2,4-diacetamido-2,4,6-trideoxy-beta-L-altropyranose hydrolase [Acinetobacter baumannii]